MKRVVLAAALLVASLSTVSCSNPPGPSDSAQPTDAAVASDDLPLDDPVADQLGDATWRRAPIILDDARTAIFSDACATQARESLNSEAADLPTAVIDARGSGLATVLMADDLDAILCLVSIDASGVTMRTTVDRIDRLRRASVEPVDDTDISLAGLVRLSDRGDRTLAFGRIGPGAFQARIGFDDATVVPGTTAEGWWAMWWPGGARPTSISSVDRNGLALGSTKVPDGEVEARIGSAEWWIDPAGPELTPESTVVQALLRERACASGRTPEGRVDDPLFELTDSAVIVTVNVRHQPGEQDCQGNPNFRMQITLPEPLGNRNLLDGGSFPPRNASKPPD